MNIQQWYVLGLIDNNLGSVVAYSTFDNEEDARVFGGAGRGEMADRFNIFLNVDIPDSFSVEVISAHDFQLEYAGRMPLNNFVPAC